MARKMAKASAGSALNYGAYKTQGTCTTCLTVCAGTVHIRPVR